eukprot:scaffold113679_cov71-Phaeocystis_antarctica.AAC.2
MGPTRLAGLDGLGWLEPWYDADEAAGAKSLDTLQTPEEVFGHVADTRRSLWTHCRHPKKSLNTLQTPEEEFEHIADTRRRV